MAVLRYWFLEYSLLRSIAFSILEYSFLRSILSGLWGWLWPAALVDALAQAAGWLPWRAAMEPRTSGVRLRIARLLVQSGRARRWCVCVWVWVGGGGLSTSIHCERAPSKRTRFESTRSRFEMQSRASALDSEIESRASALDATSIREQLLSAIFYLPARRSRCEFGSKALVLGAISRRKQALSI